MPRIKGNMFSEKCNYVMYAILNNIIACCLVHATMLAILAPGRSPYKAQVRAVHHHLEQAT